MIAPRPVSGFVALLSLAALMSGRAALNAQPSGAQSALTPGTIVLLASRSGADAQQTIRRALIHQAPDVRRAAARVASVAHPDTFKALLEALALERDPAVAAEMVKDAMALGGHDALSFVEPFALRAGAEAVAEVAEWFARMDPDGIATRLPVWMRVANAEARLVAPVRSAVIRRPSARALILAAWKDVATGEGWRRVAEPRKDEIPAPVVMRTPVGLAEQFLQSTIAAADCRPSADHIGSADIRYAPDGRPRAVAVEASELRDACQSALIALARISTDPGDSVDSTQTLALPVSSDFLQCVPTFRPEPVEIVDEEDDPQEAPSARRVLRRDVVSPALEREVKPSYTGPAMKARITGLVEMTGVVYESGCIGRIAVTRSLPLLDRQAIRAVTQWRFRPGSVAGRPAPVIVNVELTFTLGKK